MKVFGLGIALALAMLAADFRLALPGYEYEFPRDHFNHPEFQTEWWYYTGNLRTAEGRRFGFELTFFRHGLARPAARTSPWQVDDLYLAHLALSDIDGRKFYHRERVNRAGPGIAGASAQQLRIWNGNWHVNWSGNSQSLEAVADAFKLSLELTPQKPPVIHGRGGVSQKGAEPGRASHYISFTRLATVGTLELNGVKYAVSGTSWMDHEFFTNQLAQGQIGWDWFSIQLENGVEFMFARLRRADGSVDPYSQGTYMDAAGKARHLESAEFSLTPGEAWTSPATGAEYPVRWSIRAPGLGLSLDATTPLRQQELAGRGKFSPAYWEGAMDFEGSFGDKPVRGVGYLEMTGYAAPVKLTE